MSLEKDYTCKKCGKQFKGNKHNIWLHEQSKCYPEKRATPPLKEKKEKMINWKEIHDTLHDYL